MNHTAQMTLGAVFEPFQPTSQEEHAARLVTMCDFVHQQIATYNSLWSQDWKPQSSLIIPGLAFPATADIAPVAQPTISERHDLNATSEAKTFGENPVVSSDLADESDSSSKGDNHASSTLVKSETDNENPTVPSVPTEESGSASNSHSSPSGRVRRENHSSSSRNQPYPRNRPTRPEPQFIIPEKPMFPAQNGRSLNTSRSRQQLKREDSFVLVDHGHYTQQHKPMEAKLFASIIPKSKFGSVSGYHAFGGLPQEVLIPLLPTLLHATPNPRWQLPVPSPSQGASSSGSSSSFPSTASSSASASSNDASSASAPSSAEPSATASSPQPSAGAKRAREDEDDDQASEETRPAARRRTSMAPRSRSPR